MGDNLGSTGIKERVRYLEANYGDMKESMLALTTTIENLNEKIDNLSSKFSVASGIFAAALFIAQAVIIPVTISLLVKR